MSSHGSRTPLCPQTLAQRVCRAKGFSTSWTHTFWLSLENIMPSAHSNSSRHRTTRPVHTHRPRPCRPHPRSPARGVACCTTSNPPPHRHGSWACLSVGGGRMMKGVLPLAHGSITKGQAARSGQARLPDLPLAPVRTAGWTHGDGVRTTQLTSRTRWEACRSMAWFAPMAVVLSHITGGLCVTGPHHTPPSPIPDA